MASMTATTTTMSALSPTSRPISVVADRVVRFDNECILIPESPHSKRPKMLTKTYSLPLWKRKTHHLESTVSDGELDEPSSSAQPDEHHIVFKVPIPSFIRKSSKSPNRGRTPSNSPPSQPLSPCLVHRSPSELNGRAGRPPVRRPSLPTSKERQACLLTIPLRACCTDCVAVTEKCLLEGNEWQEHFSRGARRRRSASLDNTMETSVPIPSTSIFSTNPPTIRFPTPFALTVDEVDMRRKSLDNPNDDGSRIRLPSSPIASSSTHHGLHDRELSSSSDEFGQELSLTNRPQSSPIAEEDDEDQLFPLPSPRRSPNNSPTPSINQSPSPSPVPSPNGSSSCLGFGAAVVPSASSDSLRPPSEEALAGSSISRRSASGGLRTGLLTVSASPNGAALAPTSHAVGLTSTDSVSSNSSAASSASAQKKIRAYQNVRSTKVSQHLRTVSAPVPDTVSSTTSTSNSPKPTPTSSSTALPAIPAGATIPDKSKPLPIPIPASTSLAAFPSTSSPSSSSSPGTFYDRLTITTSSSGKPLPTVPSTSGSPPSPSSPKRMRSGRTRGSSFSIRPAAALLKVGADVLRGVSSISGGGVGGVVGSAT